MVRKFFKVTVNGEVFQVEVEEVAGDISTAGAGEQTAGTVTAKAPEKMQAVTETASAAIKDTPVKEKEVPPAAVKDIAKKEVEKPVAASAAPPASDDAPGVPVKAPMPGSIIEVKVAVGDQVNEDDVLVILEAMKMENEVTSPSAGTVAQIMVNKGSTVNSGDTLLVIR